MINNLLIDNVPISHFLIFSATLFVIGICGIMINKKSIINILFSIEIMLLSVNLNFIAFSKIWIDITGQIFSIFILTVAAAEAAIGLAILVLFFRNKSDISIDRIKKLKG
ncbi:NADH-quinone oxidoreductase subunit NuoK [Candidatus Aquarickettsia rohweri]|uniref:NADH-quinone oxidoreductase subunit K n=1 Tax=Candidatus Aquarickettsia rohweri TaxID=2602574 RepID=A0A3R9XKG8_9RICK|nr:NADH-quinone oxidoreductase subunit NuoK [Candidatus Aquarickettsia rohweri]RST62873.1 NADH-quinone oxidoreductase subunit NuoK [Candidatus Aquarickettsia rohweri]